MEEKIGRIVDRIYIGEVISLEKLYLNIFTEIELNIILKYVESLSDFTTFIGKIDKGGEEMEHAILIERLDNTVPGPPDSFMNDWKKRNKGTILEYTFERIPYVEYSNT